MVNVYSTIMLDSIFKWVHFVIYW